MIKKKANEELPTPPATTYLWQPHGSVLPHSRHTWTCLTCWWQFTMNVDIVSGVIQNYSANYVINNLKSHACPLGQPVFAATVEYL